ncbi:MAG: hypothetical protein CME65_04160 [Halobacteriovoraceae bacterium]|nr:hypothetical protein [Halobacteriovoraceae bacterium]|tara:strand:+ start:16609 stop:17277 length:669 start_codon:yes stop_codon:yes gene_type:complete
MSNRSGEVPRIYFKEHSELEDIAEKLVHNACTTYGHKFPFDIEGYIWKNFKYRIQPTPNAEVSCNVDTALIVCKKLIRIDERVYDKQYPRARFSMAHEVGHLILHHNYLDFIQKKLKEASMTDEFNRIILSLPDKDSRRAEYQAQYIGGAILAPKYKLKEVIKEFIQKNFSDQKGELLDEEQRDQLYTYVASYFEMNKSAIITRIDRCELSYLIDFYVKIEE